MARRVDSAAFDRLKAQVDLHPEGVSIDSLMQLVSGHSRRTIQRWLHAMVEEGHVVPRGRGPATLYVPAEPRRAVESEPAASEDEIPLSREAQSARRAIRQPAAKRKPVGYNRRFLQSYRPNVTRYLSRATLQHLKKIGTVMGAPRPAGTYAREVMNRLLIDLSWASSRLEGNTYTRLDTRNLIEFGKVAEGKDAQETQMILNHKSAIEFLIEDAESIGFNPFTFRNLHALLSENLLADPSEGGRVRTKPVSITGTVYVPLAIPQQLEQYFELLLKKAGRIDDPFEQAFFIMAQLPYLQPFIDVNKRVSRLGANIPLIKSNLCPLSFEDVPEALYTEGMLAVYERNNIALLRDVFVWAYERTAQRYAVIKDGLPEPDPMRLRYREVLIGIVGDIVRNQLPPTQVSIRKLAKTAVAEGDLDRFVELASSDLEYLHEGNVSRYRLRLSEYQGWKPRQKMTSPRPRARGKRR